MNAWSLLYAIAAVSFVFASFNFAMGTEIWLSVLIFYGLGSTLYLVVVVGILLTARFAPQKNDPPSAAEIPGSD